MSPRWLVSLTALLLALLFAPPALAGGWAIVTLDELPGAVRPGEPIQIGFMVLQHGRTATSAVSPYLLASNSESGESIRANAVQDGPEGHFVVEVTFPSAGRWTWEIVPDPFEATRFEPLEVQAAPLAQPAGGSSGDFGLAPNLLRAGLRGAGIALLIAAAVLAARGRRRPQAEEQA